MKLTYKIDEVKTKNILNIAFDVSKDDLHLYTEIGNQGKIQCISDDSRNHVKDIKSKLNYYKSLAQENGYDNIQVICEPTGGYEKKLLSLARQMDCYTSYVNGESVSKYKVIENNESSKTDIKDPRVIFLIAKFGKLIKYRLLPEEYNLLRNYNRMHEQENEQKTYYKNLLHHEIKNLFCDFSFKNAFLFETSGRALVKRFHCNPYRIIRCGYAKFSRMMKQYAPRIRKQTLERLWEDAKRSAKLVLTEKLIELLDKRIMKLWQNYLNHERSLAQIKEQMSEIYQRLLDYGEALPKPVEGFVVKANLARIIGETGPLGDFNHERQIKRFGGLSLRQRQSGKYRGKDKLSKKGRSRLRLILNQSIFRLIKKDCIFGEFYHRKKAQGMPGTKAMTVVSRKLISVLFALSRPGVEFDQKRLFVCESQLKKAA